MDAPENITWFSEKLKRGVTFLIIAQILNLALSVYSLTTLGVELDPQTLAAGGGNPLATVLGCLSPVAVILQIIGLVLILQDSRRLGGLHRKFSNLASVLFTLSIAGIIGSSALSFIATTQGTAEIFQLINWLSMLATVFSFLALTLLLYAVSPSTVQMILVVGALLVAAGSIGSTLMTLQNLTLEPYDMMGNTYYIPSSTMDQTQGLYPLLVLFALVGNLAYLVSAIWIAVLAGRPDVLRE